MQVAYAEAMKKSQPQPLERPMRRVRRLRLDALIAAFGGATQLADLAGSQKTHLSAIQAGNRDVGDVLATKIEEATGQEFGWMDIDPDLWPFRQISHQKVLALDISQLAMLEAAVALSAERLGLDVQQQVPGAVPTSAQNGDSPSKGFPRATEKLSPPTLASQERFLGGSQSERSTHAPEDKRRRGGRAAKAA